MKTAHLHQKLFKEKELGAHACTKAIQAFMVVATQPLQDIDNSAPNLPSPFIKEQNVSLCKQRVCANLI